jgi:uncharacterized membrane protein
MWLIYVLLTIFSYAGLDFFIKRMAGKIDDLIGIIILSAVSVLPSLVILLLFKFSDKRYFITSNGVFWAILGGLALGIGTLSFLKLFDTGINLSLASPMVRIGILIVTTSLGLFVLRETVEIKEWIGLALASLGLLLLVWK